MIVGIFILGALAIAAELILSVVVIKAIIKIAEYVFKL